MCFDAAGLRAELIKLEAQEERLIELAADGTLASTKLRDKLQQILLKKGAITEKLNTTEERLQYGADLVLAQIDMLANPGELYRRVSDDVRRDLFGAMFSELTVHVQDDAVTIETERTEISNALHQWDAQRHLADTDHVAKTKRAPRNPTEGSSSFAPGSLNASKRLEHPSNGRADRI